MILRHRKKNEVLKMKEVEGVVEAQHRGKYRIVQEIDQQIHVAEVALQGHIRKVLLEALVVQAALLMVDQDVHRLKMTV